MISNFNDPCSLSNPEFFITTHVDIDWRVNFEKKVIDGVIEVHLKRNSQSLNDFIILDSKDLSIHQITDKESNVNLNFEFGEKHHSFGSSLKISLKNVDNILGKNKIILVIKYTTSENSSALQWLDANLTIGKKHPYLFSQCQAIHARSLIPCHDTPLAKFTYNAKVTVGKVFVALMSAFRKNEKANVITDDLVQYEFEQNTPIPSYLLALAVGDLASKQIGPRSHVWTERELLDDAAYEFAETEEMLKTAESLMGPYVWRTYDLLILPPSFPYGGMENPCLTFVTPTLIAGDRSLADVVIHEISHSWTGNLVTNKNWEHFWLNEGFTMFAQRKILARMKKSELYRQFDCLEGWRKLKEAVKDFGATNQLTNLVPNLTDVDPDDSFSSIPYEKGHMLLYHLEEKLGGVEIFDKYLRAHIEKFKGKCLDTDEWKSFLYEFFNDKTDILNSIDWNGWLHTPGMPPVTLNFDKTLANQCSALVGKVFNEEINGVDPSYKEFSSSQVIEFVSELLDKDPLPASKVESLEKYYKFGSSKNCEILFKWIRIGIKAEWEPIIDPALKFLNSQGRMKYSRPVYRDLFKWSKAKQLTIDNFKKERKFMHQTTASLVAKDLELA